MNSNLLELGTPRFAGGDRSWTDLLSRLPPAQALATVEGSFAVALPLADGRTVLAVDRFAQETLCYRVVDGQLRVSERADRLGSTAVDPQALFDYLYFHDIPSPRTVFADVFRLPPGHYAVFQDGRLDVARYWTPTFAPESSPSFPALRDEFLQTVEQAVASRLGDGPAACFLSGGTDSSTVAGMVSRITGGKAVTYSIGFEAQGYDEMAFARIAARHFGTEHREYYVTPDDLVRSIAHVAASYDQPFGNSSALPAYYCALKAREDGVQRMLAGDGGDELFGGNSRYATQRVFGWYRQVPGFLRSGLLEPFFGLGPVAATPLLRKGSSYIHQANVPLPDRLQMYNLVRRLGLSDVLTPGFLGRVDPEDVMRQQRAVWAEAHAGSDLDRMLAFDWRYTLAESDLPKVRGTTRLAGVEVAVGEVGAATPRNPDFLGHLGRMVDQQYLQPALAGHASAE